MNKHFDPVSLHELLPAAKRLRLSKLLEDAIELDKDPDNTQLSLSQWLKMLFDREVERRDNGQLERRCQQARFRYHNACVASIDWNKKRKLDAALINTLASGDWIRNHQNCIITGATGCGKTWLSNALGHAACMAGFNVCYSTLYAFLREQYRIYEIAGSLDLERKYEAEWKKTDLLILDDWGLGSFDPKYLQRLYRAIESCSGRRSVMIVSVLPVKHWQVYINDPTFADSVLDRLVWGAHRIELEGASMRSRQEYGAVPKFELKGEELR